MIIKGLTFDWNKWYLKFIKLKLTVSKFDWQEIFENFTQLNFI